MTEDAVFDGREGCSTTELRSRIVAAVARSFILVRASSYIWRDTRRAVDAVQRCFREQPPQSFALAR
jgi:hypothetical protein